MALRVWLPLNGTLENKGISDNITYAIVSGNSFTSSGKIGNNALKLTKIQQILSTTSCMTGAKEVSYAFWVKVNTAWSTDWLDGIRWTSTDGTSTATERQEFYTNCTLVGTWYKGGAIYGGAFTPGVWTHLAATINYNTGEACLYINGDLKGTTSNVDTTYYCRGDFYIGDNGVDILQNDVRIYDHCLSAKEVKEISQGLILHYKLNNESITNYSSANNLIPNYKEMGLGSANVSTGTWRVAGSTTMTRTRVKITDSPIGECYCFQNSGVQTPNDGSCYGIDSTTYFEPDTEYRISMFARITDGSDGWAGYNIYNISSEIGGSYTKIDKNYRVTPLNPDGSWTYCWYHFKTNSVTTRNIYIGITTGDESVTTQMCLVRIDKWDDGMNRICDSSGYGNNVTITNAMYIQKDSKRYEISSYLNKKKISCSNGFLTTDDPIFTVSLWFKLYSNITYTAYADLISFTTESYSSQPFRLELCGSPVGRDLMWFRGPSGSTGGFGVGPSGSGWYTLDEWHHVALVSSGNKQYISYFDGKQTNTFNGSAYTWTPTGGVSIGDTAEGTASMNDFRIYATALSAEDILDLYHTSANVDDLGNLHGFEFVDTGENLVYNANIAISGALDRNANGIRLYSQTNCISSFEDNYIRIYRPPNIIHDSSTMHNMWGGLRLRNSSNGSVHVYNSSTDNIFNLQKGHTYVMYFTVKGKSTNAATSIGWTNDMGWGGGGLIPTPSNVEYLYTPVNFNGEMDCFYKFTINDDIVKTCTNSYGNFVAGNQYMSYCDFMYGFGYENTGSLGTDVKVNNLRLYDITSISNSDITLSGIVNSLSFVEDDYTTVKIRRYGEILENLIIEK